MAYNIIRPRRGIKSLWQQYKSRIYKQGEMLVESPETGVGTGMVDIKFGDGVTDYEHLPYAALAPTSEVREGFTRPITSDGVFNYLKDFKGGDEVTVRYNTETDMIQLLYENEWHDWKKAGLQLEYLFTANNNAAGFAATSEYSTNHTRKLPRLSVGETLIMNTDSEPSTAWVIISQPVNVENYAKICMNHKTYFTGNSGQYDKCSIWVVDVLGESPLTPLALNTYMDGTTKTLSGILELDVSELSGEIHVAIQVNTNNCDSCTVEISEMWLE